MVICRGQHVHVDFHADDQWYQAVVLDVADSETMVQQVGTTLTRWVPLSRVRG